MKVLTGARGVLSAAHRSRDGIMHGHTWEIVAWWTGEPDAVEKQRELNDYLKVFDHTVLADGVAWAESLGRAMCMGLECVKVEISRPLEGLYAVVEQSPSLPIPGTNAGRG